MLYTQKDTQSTINHYFPGWRSLVRVAIAAYRRCNYCATHPRPARKAPYDFPCIGKVCGLMSSMTMAYIIMTTLSSGTPFVFTYPHRMSSQSSRAPSRAAPKDSQNSSLVRWIFLLFFLAAPLPSKQYPDACPPAPPTSPRHAS